MEKLRAKSKSGVLYRIWDDLPYLGGVYSIEYAKNCGDCVVWARPTTRSGAYRYGLTSDYNAIYGIFISLINQ